MALDGLLKDSCGVTVQCMVAAVTVVAAVAVELRRIQCCSASETAGPQARGQVPVVGCQWWSARYQWWSVFEKKCFARRKLRNPENSVRVNFTYK